MWRAIDNASDGQDYVANATQPDNRHRFVAALSYDVPNLFKRHPRLVF